MRVVVVAIAVLLLAAGCGGSHTASSGSPRTCEKVTYPLAKNPVILKAPGRLLDASKTYTLNFDTTCGTFAIRLDTKLAPHTAASLVSLAREKYYDDTPVLRIWRGVLVQAGDPTQTGAGQPGYETIDVPPRSTHYTRGTVGMAKSQLDAAGVAGSQFFIMTKKEKFPPVYAVVGKVVEGQDVVDRIGELGDQKQIPVEPIVIRTVKVDVGS
jgi:cyclophilin family peptidyl-prolyl cis-trans isomerase